VWTVMEVVGRQNTVTDRRGSRADAPIAQWLRFWMTERWGIPHAFEMSIKRTTRRLRTSYLSIKIIQTDTFLSDRLHMSPVVHLVQLDWSRKCKCKCQYKCRLYNTATWNRLAIILRQGPCFMGSSSVPDAHANSRKGRATTGKFRY